jgi:uncharacterized RDD family membrane protein YckC
MWCSRCDGECRGHQEFSFTATEPVSATLDPATVGAPGALPAWRQEVSRRVRGFHSRRRPRSERNRSIGFDFEAAERATPAEAAAVVAIPEPPPRTTPAFLRALEAQEAAGPGSLRQQIEQLNALRAENRDAQTEPQFDGGTLARLTATVRHAESRASDSNLIEFPGPLEPAIDLAEPVIETPRIFEVEEVAAVEREQEQLASVLLSAPAVPSITLDPEAAAAPTPELDLPLPVAPLELRAFAGVVDVFAVAACTVGFWFIASLVGFPQGRAAFATLTVVALGVWGVYQYLFLSRLGRTPGMNYIGLRIVRVQPKPLTRGLLAARALSVVLSSAAAGLGFFWALVEEDRLTWHDRITQTFVTAR